MPLVRRVLGSLVHSVFVALFRFFVQSLLCSLCCGCFVCVFLRLFGFNTSLLVSFGYLCDLFRCFFVSMIRYLSVSVVFCFFSPLWLHGLC